MITITRKIEFDAGHRIPDHNSQCRNLHGHRYTMLITLIGEVVKQDGVSDNGMIMDFSDVKELAYTHLVSAWDHAFLVYEKDTVIVEFLKTLPGHKTVAVDRVPTVENLVQLAFDTLKQVYHNRYGRALALQKIVLYETPNCWAEASQ
jgi:6-pyruvoyltetrahydropterin/6-carboxytetrahydropterin synthase